MASHLSSPSQDHKRMLSARPRERDICLRQGNISYIYPVRPSLRRASLSLFSPSISPLPPHFSPLLLLFCLYWLARRQIDIHIDRYNQLSIVYIPFISSSPPRDSPSTSGQHAWERVCQCGWRRAQVCRPQWQASGPAGFHHLNQRLSSFRVRSGSHVRDYQCRPLQRLLPRHPERQCLPGLRDRYLRGRMLDRRHVHPDLW